MNDDFKMKALPDHRKIIFRGFKFVYAQVLASLEVKRWKCCEGLQTLIETRREIYHKSTQLR